MDETTEFTPITTQEALDALLGAREAQVRGEYADYDTIKGENETLRNQVAQKDSAIAGLNVQMTKLRVAQELGLPAELYNRLNGETEKDIRKDAETLKALLGASTHSAPPLASTEPVVTDPKMAAYRELLNSFEEA